MTARRARSPVVYGHPDWIETYLTTVVKVLECQPEGVLTDDGVRRASGELVAFIQRNVA